jgi:hypothetical protein
MSSSYSGTISNGGTISTTSGGILWPQGEGQVPPSTPKGLLATRAVETAEGWLGHLIVDKEIVYQTKPHPDSAEAMHDVNSRVVARLKWLFGTPPKGGWHTPVD